MRETEYLYYVSVSAVLLCCVAILEYCIRRENSAPDSLFGQPLQVAVYFASADAFNISVLPTKIENISTAEGP